MKKVTVSECNEWISHLFNKDYILHNLAVSGTVSNLRIHSSGRVYFSLMDSKGRIFCVISPERRTFLTRRLYNGCEATCSGTFIYSARRGYASLYVDRITGIRTSEMTEKARILYEQLEKKGYFSPLHKKLLPSFPEQIGIIASSTGAVWHDVIKTGRMRNDSIRYTVLGCRVQGEEASQDMANRIREAQTMSSPPDILILARGGGAEEDLQPFNDAELLEAIHKSSIPVVSAVGHETDVTLADLTADVRASTPTQAAELCIPEKQSVQEEIVRLMHRMADAAAGSLGKAAISLNVAERRLTSPEIQVRLTEQGRYVQHRYMQLYVSLHKVIDARKIAISEKLLHGNIALINHMSHEDNHGKDKNI